MDPHWRNPRVTGGFPAQRTVMQETFSCHDVIMEAENIFCLPSSEYNMYRANESQRNLGMCSTGYVVSVHTYVSHLHSDPSPSSFPLPHQWHLYLCGKHKRIRHKPSPVPTLFSISSPEYNHKQFEYGIFKYISWQKMFIFYYLSTEDCLEGVVDKESVLVQVMACRQSDDTPLLEKMLTKL